MLCQAKDVAVAGGDGAAAHEGFNWKIKFSVKKYVENFQGEAPAGAVPYETIEVERNLLMYGGASCLWQCLLGNGTGTGGQTLTYFNNGNAAIGIGDSNTAAAATQTDLQASSNKVRRGMVATYPQHTDAVTSGAATVTWQSSFDGSTANYAWAEVGIFNSATAATGRMLNRLVQSFGTKASGTWTMTITTTLA